MPNIRSQEVTRDGLSIVASDGRSFAITRAEIIAFFQAQTGTRTQRRNATIAEIKARIEAALGAEQVPASALGFDFDDLQPLAQLRLDVTD